jgi:DNA polymerase-1
VGSLLIVDGDNLAHRAYHSTPKTVRGADDQPINAVVGFFSMLIGVWKAEKPRGVFVAWDTLGIDTYRSELWPPYQGGRVFDPEIRQQLAQLPGLCSACGLAVGKAAGYEADDLMAAAALKEVAQGGTAVILTADRDTFQLASDAITILWPRKGIRQIERIGPHEVVQIFGVLPEQVPDFKALSGDASDKIPGIRGIGPKAAASLLLRYGDLEGVLENWNRPQDAELALKFREVARMRPDVSVEIPDGPPRWGDGAPVLAKLGASNLAARLLEL